MSHAGRIQGIEVEKTKEKGIFQKTLPVKPLDVEKVWWLVDAKGKNLGRLATLIAHKLRGKDKTNFTPYVDCGDNVIVINAKDIIISGAKEEQKLYKHHSGYTGGLKSRKYSEIMESKPEFPLRQAVKGMLPKNRLGSQILGNLKIYADDTHKQHSQKPQIWEI